MTILLLKALKTIPTKFLREGTRILEVEDIVVASNPKIDAHTKKPTAPMAYRSKGSAKGTWTPFCGVVTPDGEELRAGKWL